MKNEICNRCPHEDTEKCETCEKRTCRICGCTWNNACPGGCHWVEFDLCSECVGKEASVNGEERIMQRLVYTVDINEEMYGLDFLLDLLDAATQSGTGCEILRSRLESPDEVCETGEWEAANGEDE